MSAYDDKDSSTPNSLLDEAVKYARRLLNDFEKARIITGNKWNPKIQSIGIECLSQEVPNYIVKEYRKGDNLVIRSEGYTASHPAIVDSFHTLLEKLMKNSGLIYTRGKQYPKYRENDFDIGTSRSLLTTMSIGIFSLTSPEKLRQALTVNDDQLRLLVLKSLQKEFVRMRKVSAQFKKAGMDTTSLLDPVAFVQELQEKGLSGPKVIKVAIDIKKPSRQAKDPNPKR